MTLLEHKSVFKETKHYLLSLLGKILLFNITGKSNLGIDDTIITTWYRNGRRLPSGSRLGPLKRTHLNISQSLTLENSSIFDEGTYNVLLTYTLHISHLGCHRNYYTFVDRTVRADDTVLAQAQLQLKYYGKSMN